MNVFEIIVKYLNTINMPEFTICLTGSLLLGYWLLRTSLGTKALDDSVLKRNNMPVFLPFLLLLVSYFSIGIISLIASLLVRNKENLQGVTLDYIVTCISGLLVIIIIIFSIRPFFARRLKGFGLNIRTIFKDFAFAIIYFIAIWPVVMVAVTITLRIGHLLYGQDYQMPQHETLKTISENLQLMPLIFSTTVAVMVVPFLEELLFRGLFQTMIRSILKVKYAAWLTIAISSSIFVLMHEDTSHWPTLFVLGIGLGYSYEKSGSLFRPVFIHMFFNAMSIASLWVQYFEGG
ncbi:MAG: CPBP family intramembrane metalloprotease [Sedimentisphaerales bacterium]|nr:CPBP family intramembrane metalloprotease [Sedimentisphaerales bacterium]